MVDYPARGRSAYVPLPGPDGKQPIDGNLGIRTALELERIFTNARERGDFPLKMNHTQWPGPGRSAIRSSTTFIKTQVQFAGAHRRVDARGEHRAPRRDRIAGDPVHPFAGRRLRVRPDRGAAEPRADHGDGGAGRPAVRRRRHGEGHAGPAQSRTRGASPTTASSSPRRRTPRRICNVVLEEKSDRPDEVRCWMQVEPARKLTRWQGKRVLAISANGTYHRVYDPCIPKFLNQAGVKTDFIRLEDVGPQRQRPHDDAGEEQRRHHQVRHRVAAEEHRDDVTFL